MDAAFEGFGGGLMSGFRADEPTDVSEERVRRETVSFEELYRAEFAFVWRSLLRLGADRNALDDLVQEVFLVVHRKLDAFEGRSSTRTWLYGILRRVAADHRRTRRRKTAAATSPDDVDRMGARDPGAAEARMEAADLVDVLLEELDDDKREVLVLAELEGMTMAEIAEAIDVNPNTVSARLRAARKIFSEALARHEQRDAERGAE